MEGTWTTFLTLTSRRKDGEKGGVIVVYRERLALDESKPLEVDLTLPDASQWGTLEANVDADPQGNGERAVVVVGDGVAAFVKGGAFKLSLPGGSYRAVVLDRSSRSPVLEGGVPVNVLAGRSTGPIALTSPPAADGGR